MLEEFSKTVKAQLYERASSPLLGSFAIAWCIWNHRFIMVIFSELSFQEKIRYIDFHIFGGWQEYLANGIGIPLAAALFMILVYPWPSRFLYSYWRKQQNKIKADQQIIDGDVLLSVDESREIRQAEIKMKIEFDGQLRTKNEEITYLKEMIEELNKKTESEQPERLTIKTENATSDELTESQMRLLENISKSGVVYKNSSINKSKDKLLMEFDFGELLNRELTRENFASEVQDYKVTITHQGTKRLVHARKSLPN